MIDLEKIEEWIREVEERPASGPMIIRYVANRLSELSKRNEALLADNIELRTDKKVEEYESRIANLEYQVGLLKRQLGGLAMLDPGEIGALTQDKVNLILFNTAGQIVRANLAPGEMTSGQVVASFSGIAEGEINTPGFLATSTQEELLLLYDSGRALTLRVSDIPVQDPQTLNWSEAFIREPRSGETLSEIAPVARMSLHEFALQVSRRGFAKKIMEGSFESFLANNFIGSGVKVTPDKPYGLVFGRKEDWLVMVSREGFLVCVEFGRLPFAVEEVLHLSPTDHIEAAMAIPRGSGLPSTASILVVTDHGKVINRDETWLEPATSFRTRGQALFSKERRSGVEVVGSALANRSDWGFAFHADGKISAHMVSDLFDAGSISLPGGGVKPGLVRLASFCTYAVPGAR